MRLIRIIVVLAALAAPSTLAAQDAQSRLWDAAIAGDTAAIRAAVNAGAVVDSLDVRTSQNGRRPLNWAALGNHVDALRLLLELGAPIDARNRTGFTALHHAAEEGSTAAAEFLIAAGADRTLVNQQGLTPLDVARENYSTAVARLLEAAATD